MTSSATLAGLLFLLGATASPAATLDGKTLDAWNDYVYRARANMAAHVQARGQFLWADEKPELRRELRDGQIYVAPVGSGHPRRVPSGLIHDWLGAAFLPNATMQDAIRVVSDYDRYQEFYQPLMVESTSLGSDGRNYRFSLVIVNKTLFSESALQAKCEDAYFQVDVTRWYSVGSCDSVREIEDYGKTARRELRPDEGAGYIWRMASFSRFEERDGGVYVEREVMALSRELPGGLRWFLEPIVNRLSKKSLSTSLLQTREAVLSYRAAVRQRDTSQTVRLRRAVAFPSDHD